MDRILYLLTGGAVDGMFHRFIEKFDEPRLRRKATEQGFSVLFEERLMENRYKENSFASLRAFGEARRSAIDSHMTTDPMYAEVSRALAQYKFCLVNTSHRCWWHRFKYRCGEPDATNAEKVLREAGNRARQVVNASEANRTALRIMVSQQPVEVRRIDNFISLIEQD